MKHELEITTALRANIITLGRVYSNRFPGIAMVVISSSFSLNYRYSLIRVSLVFGILFFAGFQLNAQSKLDKSGNQSVSQNGKKGLPGLEAAKIPSGITFHPELEKVYGDADYELGQEFDMNGMLINYTAEDTSIIRIEGNWAMILKAGETKVFAEISEYQEMSNSVPLVQNLTVLPSALKLTVLPGQKKVFGDLDPDFEFEAEGLVYGEGKEKISGSLNREPGENAGNYTITLGDLDAGANYKVEFAGADFEITARELIVEAKAGEKYFGASDPTLNYVVQGMESEDLSEIVSGQLKREVGESIGKYAIEEGTLEVAENFKLTFQEGIFEIKATELSAVFDPTEIETSWSIMPEFPSHISALTSDGQILNLPVNWVKSGLNLLEKGSCSISGQVNLPDGILNPQLLKPSQKLTVLPKPSPKDVLLSQEKFEPVSSKETVEIGQFSVIDELDDTHSIVLVGGSLDNSQFEINGLSLSWKSAANSTVKNQYSILVKVLDRAGNTLEKQFDLSAEFTQLSSIRVHNVFTPNNDGFNDTWGIPAASETEGIQIRVFSKNGELLFETENSKNEWDGTFRGRSLPADTYFWVISSKRSGETRKGFLSLLR